LIDANIAGRYTNSGPRDCPIALQACRRSITSLVKK